MPKNGAFDYAAVVQKSLVSIKEQLGHFTGRVFYKGTSAIYVNQSMGKNTISKVPFEMPTLLEKNNPSTYTFHLLRRSSATAAADSGASVQQLMNFYCWNNPNMPQQYVSSSKAAVNSMANKRQQGGSSDDHTESKTAKQNKNNEYHSSSSSNLFQNKNPFVIKSAQKIVIIENVKCENLNI